MIVSGKESSKLTSLANKASFKVGWDYPDDLKQAHRTRLNDDEHLVRWSKITEPLRLWLMLNYPLQEND